MGGLGEWATPLQLDVLARAESVAFLHSRTGGPDEQSAAELAELLGDLPLALAEAAAYIEQTRVGLESMCSWFVTGRWTCSAWPIRLNWPGRSGGWRRCGRCHWGGLRGKRRRWRRCWPVRVPGA